MVVILYLLTAVAFLAGCVFFGIAKSAIHEIEGLVCFLISAVLLSGGALIQTMHRLQTGDGFSEIIPWRSDRGGSISPASQSVQTSIYDHGFDHLTPEQTEEAENYLAALTSCGYRLKIKRSNLWELAAPKGGTQFIYSLGQLKELTDRLAG